MQALYYHSPLQLLSCEKKAKMFPFSSYDICYSITRYYQCYICPANAFSTGKMPTIAGRNNVYSLNYLIKQVKTKALHCMWITFCARTCTEREVSLK